MSMKVNPNRRRGLQIDVTASIDAGEPKQKKKRVVVAAEPVQTTSKRPPVRRSLNVDAAPAKQAFMGISNPSGPYANACFANAVVQSILTLHDDFWTIMQNCIAVPPQTVSL